MSAPIQNLDAFDVVGVRKDGGVDLVTSCSGPLHDSTETLQLLNRKIAAYLTTAKHPNFVLHYPAVSRGRVQVLISCGYAIGMSARGLIQSNQVKAAEQRITLALFDSVSGPE